MTGKGQRIGYGRVSSIGQSLEIQIRRLEEYGCDRVFSEKLSGKSGVARDQLTKALEYVRQGDCLVITKLDRLARSVNDLTSIVARLQEKGVDLVVLDQNIDTTTPMGKLVFHVLAAIGEFERSLIAERTAEGRAAAKARGVRFGRTSKIKGLEKKMGEVLQEFDQGIRREELAARNGVSKSTLYRLVRAAKQEQSFREPHQVTLDEAIAAARGGR